MGREIRRVPANWQHPTYRVERYTHTGLREIEAWQPLMASDYTAEAGEWDEQKAAWDRGERPPEAAKYGDISFDDWHGERPNPDWYVTYDVNGDLPWWQMYETVSEGTPVTPAFATSEELIAHLVAVGETHELGGKGEGGWSRERAEAFVLNERWAPSFMMQGGKIYDAKSGFPK